MSNPAKPLFLMLPDTISAEDVKRAEEQCGIVIVACKDPEAVRILEPPVTDASVSQQARAALHLMRKIIQHDGQYETYSQAHLVRWFVRQLTDSYPPPPTLKVKPK